MSHIIVENPNEKKKNIVLMEGSKCVFCNSELISVTKQTVSEKNWFRNAYKCKKCGTEWVGNIYDNTTLELVSLDNEVPRKNKLMMLIMALLIWLCPAISIIASVAYILVYGFGKPNSKVWLYCCIIAMSILSILL